jgi:hypothetical protein
MTQVAGALSFVHSQGVVHRDIKPSNILIEETAAEGQRALLADFGIGTIEGGVAIPGVTASSLTKTGASALGIGSRLYLAPELLEGKPPSIASDIYAFGITFFQVMGGDTTRAIGHGWEKYIKIRELQQIIALCIHVNPDERIRDVDTIHKRLQYLLTERGLESRKTTTTSLVPEPQRTSILDRLKFWKRRGTPTWEDSRPKRKTGNIVLRPFVWTFALVRWVLAPVTGLGWTIPVLFGLLILFVVVRVGDHMFKMVLLEEIDRTAKNDAQRAEGMGNFLRLYGNKSDSGAGSGASGGVMAPLTDPTETIFLNHATPHFQGLTNGVFSDLSRLYESPGSVPVPTIKVESTSKGEDGSRKAVIVVDVPAWMTDKRPLHMVCVLHRAKRFDDTQYLIGLNGWKATQFVFEGEQKLSAAGQPETAPVYRLMTIRPEEDWQASQALVGELAKYPDKYFQKGLSLRILLTNPDLIPDPAMATYVRAVNAAAERANVTHAGLTGARDSLGNERNNIRTYHSTIASLQNQLRAAEARERSKSQNRNNNQEEDNQPKPEYYRGEIERFQKLIVAAEKRIPGLILNVETHVRRTEQDDMERDLQYLNLANYLTTRFPYQSSEAARFVLGNKSGDLTIRREANQVLGYARFLVGKE